MSDKTKAELQDEIRLLKRQLAIKSEQVSDLLDAAEWDQQKLKITNDAHHATIKQACTLSDTAQVKAHDVENLVDQKKDPGRNSYKSYKPVHKLARRYLSMKRRHDPEYLGGKAAREVWEHCKNKPNRYEYVPAKKTIRDRLKNLS